ncbi:recombinase [Sporolactobacillus terrae]|uniref:Recombinase n=2 Tax=Sporolactobacillus terrae TaxID=269673 RepID=A0ABX5QBF1_9BACL|nr:recombinase [Sporolactobacillus terrae]QAA26986.1 recombinase [Sporolactobacillus terrae]UAK17909.1 tyrosine-type recombinase/integrase [Sporolactobacillus terrae]
MQEYLYHCAASGFTEKTMKNKTFEIEHLVTYLEQKRGITKLNTLTHFDLQAYFHLKRLKGNKASSLVTLHKCIHAFFSWMVSENYLKENIMDKVECPKTPKTIINTFTPNQVYRMIHSFKENSYLEVRNKAIISMLADCGLRSIEIRRLKPDDIKLTQINVLGKGNKERIVFISPALKKVLIRYERFRRQFVKRVFPHDENYFLNYLGEEITHTGLYNIIREAGKRASITGVRCSPHTFRHYYSVEALKSGKIDLYSLSRLLGHSSTAITERYLRSLEDSQLIDKAVSSSPLMNLNRANRRATKND